MSKNVARCEHGYLIGKEGIFCPYPDCDNGTEEDKLRPDPDRFRFTLDRERYENEKGETCYRWQGAEAEVSDPTRKLRHWLDFHPRCEHGFLAGSGWCPYPGCENGSEEETPEHPEGHLIERHRNETRTGNVWYKWKRVRRPPPPKRSFVIRTNVLKPLYCRIAEAAESRNMTIGEWLRFHLSERFATHDE